MASKNIQETGSLTYRELQDLNNQEALDNFRSLFGIEKIDGPVVVNKSDPSLNAERDVYSPLYDRKGDYWGKSRFDRRNPVVSDEQFETLSDLRANEQSSFNKLLNGTIKMATTAGTTFLDNTVGFVWGLGQGISNLTDDDEDTNFWKGLWDNDFNKAMMAAQDAMEKIAPNYYTQKELSNPWYKNIWTSNFWGDKFLKNMGFTLGSVASMAVGLGDIGAVAGAGVEALTKSIALGKTLKGTKLANSLYRGAKSGGQIAQKLINIAISAHGEAAIEAINAVRANEEAFLQNLDNWKRDKIQEADSWYYMNRGVPGAYEEYMQKLQDIDAGTQQAVDENDATMRSLGNSVYGMNMALLALTNNLEFGKYIKGGFNQNRSLLNNTRLLVDGAETADLRAAGRAMAAGKKVRAVADESLKKIDAGKVARVVGGTLSRNLEEGFEEGAQNLISDSGQMQAQAKVNTALKDWSDKYENTLFSQNLNPAVTDELADRSKAFLNAWNENFGGGLDSPGWEEVFLGALTGGIGTLGFKVDNQTGKVKPAWQGGFWDEITKFREEYGRQESIAEKLNETFFNNDKFRKKVSHSLATLSIIGGMEDDLINNDILKYKNKELIYAASEAFAAKDMGALEMFRGFYEGLAQHMTDEDVNDVKASFRDNVSGNSYFDNLSNDEIRKRMQEKAKSTLEKIDNVLESYDWHLRNYGEQFTAASPVPGIAETAIRELAVNESLRKDLERRKQELINNDTPEEKKSGDIKAIDNEIKDLKEKYDKYTKNPASLFDFIEEAQKDSAKFQIFKNAELAQASLANAQTIQDVADVYYHTDPNQRQGILDAVYDNASPELKQTLDQFRNYLAATQALPAVVSELMADYGNIISPEQISAYEGRIGEILDRVVNRITSNKNTNYQDPKKLVVDAIKQEANDLRQGVNGYKRTADNSSFVDWLADDLDKVADKLNLYNIVYHTAQSAKENTEPQTPPTVPPAPQQQTPPQGDENTPAVKEENPQVLLDELHHRQKHIEDQLGDKKKTLDWYLKDAVDRDGLLSGPAIQGTLGPLLGMAVEFGLIEGNPSDFYQDRVKKDTVEKAVSQLKKLGIETPSDFVPVTEQYLNKLIGTGKEAPTVSPREDEKTAQDEQLGKKENLPEGKAEVSLRGMSFLRYSVNNHVATPLKNYSTDWFHDMWASLNMGYDLDDIQNNYIWKLLALDNFKGKDGLGRISVRYVKFNNHLTKSNGEDAGLNRFVFLATEYTDAVKSVFPDEKRAKFRIIEQDGKQYLVIGSLGAYTPDRTDNKDLPLTPLEKMFNDINEEATRQLNENPDAPYHIVDAGEDGEYTNYIYQVNNGEVITRFSGQDYGPRALSELLSNPETNPRGLTINDLVFAVVMGDEKTGQLYTKFIGKDSEYENLRPFTPSYAGQVYMYLPDSTGKLIPWGVDPISYTEIMSLPEDNAVRKEVEGIIHSLAEALAGSDFSQDKMMERRMLVGQLRETLLFGSPDIKGANFEYDEYKEEESDGLSYSTGHTLSAFVGGKNLYEGKYQLGDKTPEEVEQELIKILTTLNPRYNIKATVLGRTPEYYINNGVIQTTAKVIGTLNARSFVYPVNADMTPDTEFKVTRENPEYAPSQSGPRVWFEGKRYRNTKNGFIDDETGTKITDPSTIQMLTDVQGLTPENVTFTYRKAPYWIVGDNAYTSKKKGGFIKVDKSEADKLYDYYKKRQANEEKKKAVNTELKEESETPRVQEEPPVVKKEPVEKKPVAGKKDTEESAIFVQRFSTYPSKFVTSEQAGYMNTLQGADDYFDSLGKDRIDATIFDVLAIMVGNQLGVDPTDLSMDKVRQTIWSSKYQDRLSNAVEISDESSANEAIDEIIDNIIKCGL